ncbi:MAG: FMN-binding protein [Clostridia bacterium]|nr:FMN-binding protein [Clostridia bacterium]
MKKFAVVLCVVVVLVLAAAAGLYFKLSSTPVPVIEIGTVDLKNVHDGSYTGEFDGGLVKAAVKVDVADHKITSVKILKHECGTGKKAEVITKDIEKNQSLNVDTISGATLSSNVILKATEIALTKGKP